MKYLSFAFILILLILEVNLEGQHNIANHNINQYNNTNIISQNFIRNYNDYIFDEYTDKYIVEYKDGSKKIISFNRNRNFRKNYNDSVIVILKFDVANIEFAFLNDSIIISNDWFSDLPIIQINDTTFEFHPPIGLYNLQFDLFGQPRKFVFKESINIISDTTLNFSINDANHRIEFNGLDENGNPLSQSLYSEARVSIIIPDIIMSSFNLHEDYLLVSDMTGWIYLSSQHFKMTQSSINHIHSVRFPVIKTLFQDTVLTNNPLDFLKQDIEVRFPSTSNPNIIWIFESARHDPFGGWSGSGNAIYSSTSWYGKLFINNEPDSHYVHSVKIEAEINDSSYFRQQYLYMYNYQVQNNQIGSFLGWTPSPITYLSDNEDTLIYGTTPIFPNALHLNNIEHSNQIGVYTNFYGPINEIRYYDRFVSQLSIYDSLDNSIYSGILDNFDTLTVFPGVYKAQIVNENFGINSINGRGTLNTKFDLNEIDANPPLLTSLKILNSGGKQRDIIWSNENAIIEFSAADFFILDTNINGYSSSVFQYKKVLSDSTKLWIKKHNTTSWISISINEIMEDVNLIKLESVYSARYRRGLHFFPAGSIYQAELNMISNWEDVGLDLKLEVLDQSGNSTQWILEPACFVKYREPDGIIDNVNQIKSFSLKQNYPNPFNPSTLIKYELPKPEKVKIEVYNLLGQKIQTLFNKFMPAGSHEVLFTAKDIPSGIYLYRIEAGEFQEVKKMILLR
jgi:hypothetical protein